MSSLLEWLGVILGIVVLAISIPVVCYITTLLVTYAVLKGRWKFERDHGRPGPNGQKPRAS